MSSYIDFDKNLLGYWNFETQIGGSIPDSSTYNNNGNFIFCDANNRARSSAGRPIRGEIPGACQTWRKSCR